MGRLSVWLVFYDNTFDIVLREALEPGSQLDRCICRIAGMGWDPWHDSSLLSIERLSFAFSMAVWSIFLLGFDFANDDILQK